MISKPIFPMVMFAALFSGGVLHGEPPSARTVVTWVPPYAIEKCRERLEENFEGVGPKDGLTHLALQFWLPTREGGLEKTPKYGAITDATIFQFREWAHAHGIRAMLCIYNSVDSWDWSLAQAGFASHREKFVDAIIAETPRLSLDGVDVDLEGNGESENSKDAFVSFVRGLSEKLRPLGKQLTVDSFSYQWNAPNQKWWAELFPWVDGINTMGYEQIGANGSEWRAYAAQKAAAGANAAKLLLGVPGDKAAWQNNSAGEQLDWIARDPSVGIAIWDAQFPAPFWRTAEPWKTLAKIRRSHE